MATPVLAFAQIANECEKEGLNAKNAERIAGEIAKLFTLHPDEVGILRLEKQNLVFVYPAKLGHVGTIPLNTSGAVAARAATSKRGEVINSFAQAKHISVFESVELSGKSKPIAIGAVEEKHPIQKLMVAPVLGPEGTLGVVEVCRKGTSAPASGPDFSPVDLQKLVAVCSAIAKCFKPA